MFCLEELNDRAYTDGRSGVSKRLVVKPEQNACRIRRRIPASPISPLHRAATFDRPPPMGMARSTWLAQIEVVEGPGQGHGSVEGAGHAFGVCPQWRRR